MLTSFDRAHPLMARILRMTLVFLLVFWSSFSVQSLVAFGSEGSGSPASGSTLTTADDDEPLEEDPGDPIGGVNGPEKTFVSVQVVWADSDDDAGDRPESVTARLYADGRATGDSLEVTDGDGWLGVFEDLDATDEGGLAIDYTVDVDEVEGYDGPAVEPNGDNGFFATFVWIQDEPEEPETTSVSVQVVWEDSDDDAGDRPGSVTARLYADGEEAREPLEVTADDGWQGAFEDLDVTDESGVLIEYMVSVDAVEGYEEPAVEADGEGGFVATFVRMPGADESDRYDSGKHGDETLLNLDIWTAESEDADEVHEKLTSAAEAADGEEAEPIELTGRDDQVILVAVPFWEGDAYSEDEPPSMGSADFVEWEVAGNEECVDVEENGGILTVRGAKQGEASITLRLEEDAQGLVDPAFYEEHPGEPFEAELTVKVIVPYVSAIEIQRPDGTPCLSDEELVLTKDELQSYAFRAVVRAHNQATDENADYEINEGQNLSQASEGLFDDVEWRVLDKDGEPVDPEVATITEGGVFTMVGDLNEVGFVRVECSSQQGFNGTLVNPTVIISSGKEEEPDVQGESHPQDTLRIASNARVGASQGSNGDSSTSGDGNDNAGTNPSNGSAGSSIGSGAAADASGSSASADPASTGEPIDKTYTLDELEELGSSTGTFEMRNAEGPLTVTGEGPNLVSILNDAGIQDTGAIQTMVFVDYRGVETTYKWTDLIENAERSPLVAVRSYVHEDGTATSTSDDEGANDNPSGGSADPSSGASHELLENTRFRILTDSTGNVDADTLRYINEIRVTVKSGDGTDADDALKVRIDYQPVPYGNTALLTAIPSLEVGSSRFNLKWQTSKDKVNWTDLDEGGSQTLYVVTDDTTIGTYYRVILETDMVDPETGEYRTATSDSVEIKEANEDDFYVQLAYTPPPAGQMAIFQASVNLAGRTVSEYVWEYSQDGGSTWNVIPGEKSSSFSVRTEPVSDDPDVEDEDAEPAVLTYIRVRVIATSGEVAVSNAQPLTVEVGGGGDDPDGDDKPPATPTDPSEDTTAPTLPTKPEREIPETLPDPEEPIVPERETDPEPLLDDFDDPVEWIPDDVTRLREDEEGSPVPTIGPMTQGRAVEISPEDLVVNPEISAMVQDQQAAIDEAVTASRPGARWTELNTVEPTKEDIDNILADNPLAPFALPMGLGLIAAGGVEKVLAFRRQTR